MKHMKIERYIHIDVKRNSASFHDFPALHSYCLPAKELIQNKFRTNSFNQKERKLISINKYDILQNST